MKLFCKKSKETSIPDTCHKTPLPDAALLSEIEQVKIAMDSAYSNFQNELDPDLIDCYIFERNAVMKRYHFLLKQAKLS